jgi:hypothetical protein
MEEKTEEKPPITRYVDAAFYIILIYYIYYNFNIFY